MNRDETVQLLTRLRDVFGSNDTRLQLDSVRDDPDALLAMTLSIQADIFSDAGIPQLEDGLSRLSKAVAAHGTDPEVVLLQTEIEATLDKY